MSFVTQIRSPTSIFFLNSNFSHIYTLRYPLATLAPCLSEFSRIIHVYKKSLGQNATKCLHSAIIRQQWLTNWAKKNSAGCSSFKVCVILLTFLEEDWLSGLNQETRLLDCHIPEVWWNLFRKKSPENFKVSINLVAFKKSRFPQVVWTIIYGL